MEYVYNLAIKIHMRRLGKVVVIHNLNCKGKLRREKKKKLAAKTKQSVLFSLFQV